MKKLEDKVAVVTGASKGIGVSIAKYFAAEGAKVVVNYTSDKEGAGKVVKTIADNGGRATPVQGDVSKDADVIRLLKKQRRHWAHWIFWSTMSAFISMLQLSWPLKNRSTVILTSMSCGLY